MPSCRSVYPSSFIFCDHDEDEFRSVFVPPIVLLVLNDFETEPPAVLNTGQVNGNNGRLIPERYRGVVR